MVKLLKQQQFQRNNRSDEEKIWQFITLSEAKYILKGISWVIPQSLLFFPPLNTDTVSLLCEEGGWTVDLATRQQSIAITIRRRNVYFWQEKRSVLQKFFPPVPLLALVYSPFSLKININITRHISRYFRCSCFSAASCLHSPSFPILLTKTNNCEFVPIAHPIILIISCPVPSFLV